MTTSKRIQCLYCTKLSEAKGLCSTHYSRWQRKQPMETPIGKIRVPTGYQDLTGKVFNRLTVLSRVKNNSLGSSRWLCQCVCGTKKEIGGAAIRNGDTKSCGCLHIDTARQLGKASIKHGYATRTKSYYRHSEYSIWIAMKQRCMNPNNSHYHGYGNRGITVCERWKNSFEAFLQDVGKRPSMKHSLDRIDPFKGYEPSNVRWATLKIQANNKRYENALRELDRLRSLVISLGGDPNKDAC